MEPLNQRQDYTRGLPHSASGLPEDAEPREAKVPRYDPVPGRFVDCDYALRAKFFHQHSTLKKAIEYTDDRLAFQHENFKCGEKFQFVERQYSTPSDCEVCQLVFFQKDFFSNHLSIFWFCFLIRLKGVCRIVTIQRA